MLEDFLITGIANLLWGLPSIAVLAIVLIVVSAGQFAWLGITVGRTALHARRRRQVDLRGLRQAAEISRLKSELQSSVSGTSVAWRVMEVAEVADEADDCRSYYLLDVYRQPLPMFLPGQHVLVRPAMAGAYQTTRCYSLSSPPDSRYWRITVKQHPADDAAQANSDVPQGRPARRPTMQHPVSRSSGLSSWLRNSIKGGDYLLIGGPSGHFSLQPDNSRPLVLLAAGVGITPLASMLLWSQQSTPGRPIRVLYQAQDLHHWPLGQSLHQSLEHWADGRIVSYFSRAAGVDLALLGDRLPGELRLGKFQANDAVATAGELDCDYYLCGPDAWMDSLRQTLPKLGVPADRIHWESFGSQVPFVTPPPTEVQQALAVRFQRSGIEAQWSDPQQTLWDLARQLQVDIPSGCLSGVCGGCRVKLLEGQVGYDRPIVIDLPADECLACIARPQTACRVDA